MTRSLLVHQSDLQAYARCAMQYRYTQDPARKRTQNSASAYGTVVHHALHALERERDLDKAIQTFLYYWHPLNIDQLTEPVPTDGWLPRQDYNTLRKRGMDTLRRYADLLKYDEHELLALELPFIVPLTGTPHFLAGTVDRLVVRWKRRQEVVCIDDWKALALDTPLPTPDGWTTMGAVEVGDFLLGARGRPVRVAGKSKVYEGRPCYRVTFDDGSTVVCDEKHLWEVRSGRSCDRAIRTTGELRDTLFDRRGQRQHRVDNAAALELPERALPVEPYVLGCWLGDGRATGGEISKPDEALWDNIRACGYEVRTDGMARTVRGLRTQLREAGLLGHKYVPDEYLRASRGQRLALLQGLMDTDGTWNRKRNQAVFTSTDKVLASAVAELVRSLGAKVRVWPLTKRGFGLTVAAWDVSFSPVNFNPFRLPRKAELVRDATTPARRRIVVSVERVDSVPVQCVAVDAVDSLYLCGEDMIPTHNSGKQKWGLRHNVQGHLYAYASTRPEFWTGFKGEINGRPFETEGFGEERGRQLAQRFEESPRRFTWINLTPSQFGFVSGGERTELDYDRLRLAVSQFARAIEHDVFPLNLDGDTCRFCEFRSTCGGLGLPDED